MKNKIVFYKPKHSLCGEIIAKYKGIFATVAINKKEKWFSIYSIESANQGRENPKILLKN